MCHCVLPVYIMLVDFAGKQEPDYRGAGGLPDFCDYLVRSSAFPHISHEQGNEICALWNLLYWNQLYRAGLVDFFLLLLWAEYEISDKRSDFRHFSS